MFLKILDRNLDKIKHTKNVIYDSWDSTYNNPPLIITNIPGIHHKNNISDTELKSITLKHLSKYDKKCIIYTDASKMANGCSIGIYIELNQMKFSQKLENIVSISRAEMEAIHQALILAKASNIINTVILTDSINSCFTLETGKTAFKHDNLVSRILILSRNLNATIQWIPSHVGLFGNETADKMAKFALNTDLFIETKLNHLCFTDQMLKQKDIMKTKFQEWYIRESENKGKHTKTIIPHIPLKPWYYKTDCKTSTIKITNRILAGHAFNNKYLKLIKQKDSENCETCNVTEDVQHTLLTCKKYDNERKSLQFNDINNIIAFKEKFNENSIKIIYEFVKLTNIS
jgi:ribonuclease HI